MRPFLADLHVHSVLSACADDLMLPSTVIAAARRRGVSILGLADHNSAENAATFVAAGSTAGLYVLPGMEVTTREEVHVLALFSQVADALAWQEHVYRHLPPLRNDERAFGTQLVVDAQDEILRINERLLLTATDLSLAEVIGGVGQAGGLAIPAHVDRMAFGLIGQLGFVPNDVEIPIVEFSRYADPATPAAVHRSLAGRCVVQSSDAHYPGDVGAVGTLFWIEAPTIEEIRLACLGVGGRRIEYRRHG